VREPVPERASKRESELALRSALALALALVPARELASVRELVPVRASKREPELASRSALVLVLLPVRGPVLVLAPVPRNEFAAVRAKLSSVARPLKPAAPNLVAQRKPLEILQRLRLPLPLPKVDVSNPSDAEWARLAKLPTLWFVRRRNLAYRDDLVGKPLAIAGGADIAVERIVHARIESLGLKPALDKVLASASTKAASNVISLLASPRIAASPTLTAAALGALNAKPAGERDAPLDQARVLKLSAELADGEVGEGLQKLERSAGDAVTKTALTSLASNDSWRKLDTAARSAEGTKLEQLSNRLTRVPAPPKPQDDHPEPAPAPAPKPAPRKTPLKPAAKKATAPKRKNQG